MTGVLGVLGGLICLRSFRPGSPALAVQRTDVLAAEASASDEA
jgi:hypothetical protein